MIFTVILAKDVMLHDYFNAASGPCSRVPYIISKGKVTSRDLASNLRTAVRDHGAAPSAPKAFDRYAMSMFASRWCASLR